jgi:hypothetical protein
VVCACRLGKLKLELHTSPSGTLGGDDLSWVVELVVTIKNGSTRESLFLHHKGKCLYTAQDTVAEGVDDGIPVEGEIERRMKLN